MAAEMPLVGSTERVLELDRVYDLLAGFAQTPMGAERIRRRRPLLDAERIGARHREVAEMRAHMTAKGGVGLAPAAPLDDVSAALRTRGIVLDPTDLLRVRATVGVADALRRHLRVDAEARPTIARLASVIPDLSALSDQIDRLLTAEGEVRDNASPELQRLRGRLRGLHGRVRERLERWTRDGTREGLRDSLVTERGGRLVVPVRVDARDRVRGVVHDTSSSGQTVYVEPLEFVDEQNDLARLVGEEREEVRRLLAAVTGHVAAAREPLRAAGDAIAVADALQALARYAAEVDACEPTTTAAGLRLRQACHPLADRAAFVPLDLELDSTQRGLVITGPNTGGKTVALRTVGLMALMAQAGFPVPAAEARLPLFARVHADIGDEQSLAANLSTFSAHLQHIVAFLADLPGASLVLLDELGTGTDPEEGAALAVALLDRFLEAGAVVVATTHHDALKSFAHRHADAVNAAMEFDVSTLRPTYRVRVGAPGRSNALEIAARLGLDTDLVERARGLLGAETVRMDQVIRRLEQEREDAVGLRAELENRVQELEQERARLAENEEQRATTFAALERDARRSVREATQEVRDAGRQRLRELEGEGAAVSARTRSDRRARWLARVGDLESRTQANLERRLVAEEPPIVEGAAEVAEAPGGDEALERGARVRVSPYGIVGEVLRDWSPRESPADVEVATGGKRLLVKRSQLTPAAPNARRRSGGVRTSFGRRDAVKSEIDLHGMTVEQALSAVDRYLDDAVLAGLPEVRLIHGFGTFALRNALRDWLRDRPGVRRFGPAELAQGGAGVTLVNLEA